MGCTKAVAANPILSYEKLLSDIILFYQMFRVSSFQFLVSDISRSIQLHNQERYAGTLILLSL
jgi:hypothetical protein